MILAYNFPISEHDSETYCIEICQRDIVKFLEHDMGLDYEDIEENYDALTEEYEEAILNHYEDEAKESYKCSKMDVYELHGVHPKDFF